MKHKYFHGIEQMVHEGDTSVVRSVKYLQMPLEILCGVDIVKSSRRRTAYEIIGDQRPS